MARRPNGKDPFRPGCHVLIRVRATEEALARDRSAGSFKRVTRLARSSIRPGNLYTRLDNTALYSWCPREDSNLRTRFRKPLL